MLGQAISFAARILDHQRLYRSFREDGMFNGVAWLHEPEHARFQPMDHTVNFMPEYAFNDVKEFETDMRVGIALAKAGGQDEFAHFKLVGP